MQRYLNRIRVNYPLIPQIANPNGIFSSDTTKAVQTFQGIFNLGQDGIIGRATWFKIVQLYVGVTKLASLDSEGERIGIGNTPPTIVLREGSTGAYVIELQFLLNYIGTFYSTVIPVIQDGVFRSSTTTSVRAFQRTFGLKEDGIVGPSTWNMLYDVFRGSEDEAEIPEPTPPEGYITHIVIAGDTLYLLARKFGTSVEEIMRVNNLNSTLLQIGQQLLIPSLGYATHTVVAGDTLYLLARKFGTSVEEIMRVNNLNSTLLNIGQQLIIPRT